MSKDTIACTSQFTFSNWPGTKLSSPCITNTSDTVFSSFHDITPSKLLLLVFRTNFNTEEASLRSVWCHKPHIYVRNNLWPQIASDKTASLLFWSTNINCSSSTVQKHTSHWENYMYVHYEYKLQWKYAGRSSPLSSSFIAYSMQSRGSGRFYQLTWMIPNVYLPGRDRGKRRGFSNQKK